MRVEPSNSEEVAEAVRSHGRIVAVGGRTKRGLGHWEGATVIEMGGVSGITEYQSSEYTFTALAGTRVSEVEAVLAEKGQYLPFDPLWVEAGATLGGTVASGMSGPGRFRYGGLRDFLLGVEFVDGEGSLVRSGGRVVKNAAGFDLPKFLVGSLGSFGVLTEVTFKVFPKAVASATLRVGCADAGMAVERVVALASGRLEVEAIEYGAGAVWVRIGAPGKALEALCGEVEGLWPGEVERLGGNEAGEFWRSLREMEWARKKDCLVKVPVTPSRVAGLEEAMGGCVRHYGVGGAVGWLAFGQGELGEVDAGLAALGLRGLLLGAEGRRWIGKKRESEITGAVKRALDPVGRFPGV